MVPTLFVPYCLCQQAEGPLSVRAYARREELMEQTASVTAATDQYVTKDELIQALRDENERLRAALVDIINQIGDPYELADAALSEAQK